MELSRLIAASLVPSFCAGCGVAGSISEALCEGCTQRLAWASPLGGGPPAGVDAAWSSASHDGVARDLVVALKYRRILTAADAMARRISTLIPTELLEGSIVPIPTARHRVLARGFDPAFELAKRLEARTGVPLNACLRRSGGGQQVGRRRADRRGRPPTMHAVGVVPRTCLLVDDVLTTGSTLSAAAAQLRSSGAGTIFAATFARRL